MLTDERRRIVTEIRAS